jgi:hypothetical protein
MLNKIHNKRTFVEVEVYLQALLTSGLYGGVQSASRLDRLTPGEIAHITHWVLQPVWNG